MRYKLAMASVAFHAGKLAQAEEACREHLSDSPSSVVARVLLRRIALARWGAEQALTQSITVAHNDKKSLKAAHLACISLRKLERHEEALSWAERAAELCGSDEATQLLLGLCLLDLERFEEARETFEGALTKTSSAELYNGLGLALVGLGYNRAAISSFEEAARIKPGSIEFRINLAEALLAEGDAGAAAEHSREILKINRKVAIGHALLSQALLELGVSEAAKECAFAARKLAPHDPAMVVQHAFVLQALGDLEESKAEFKKSLELEPKQGIAYYNLVRSQSLEDPDGCTLDLMKGLVEDFSIDSFQRMFLHYSLAELFERLSDFGCAVGHYDAANELAYRRKFGQQSFDESAHLKAFQIVKDRWQSGEVVRRCRRRSDSEAPIFVFGMMRAGTTLLEQVLASHPDVAAGGELPFWNVNRNKPFLCPENDAPEVAEALAKEYESILCEAASGKGRVVDKMPINFMHLGLLMTIFPRASFVHIRRDPPDTCLSIYTTQNRARLEWAHDRANIAFHYRCYLDMMEFWRMTLPSSRFLEVQYEELVSHQERETRRIIDFCGLTWSDTCLSPESSRARVTTPSVSQVRKPVHSGSIGRYARFSKWLPEFEEVGRV